MWDHGRLPVGGGQLSTWHEVPGSKNALCFVIFTEARLFAAEVFYFPEVLGLDPQEPAFNASASR